VTITGCLQAVKRVGKNSKKKKKKDKEKRAEPEKKKKDAAESNRADREPHKENVTRERFL